jgi:phospholipase C
MLRKRALLGLLGLLVISTVAIAGAGVSGGASTRVVATGGATKTPIKHVVVIYQENVSFDHYFGTYPTAANTDGSPFIAAPKTPAIDGLLPATASSIPTSLQHTDSLISHNPNSAPPVRMDASPTGNAWNIGGQLTCDQDHNYSDEQKSFDNGAMDQFVQAVGQGNGSAPFGELCRASIVMDYYDGNAVTGMWNYAQHYAMSDNSFDTTFGPSAPGAINLASGDTGNVDTRNEAGSVTIATNAAPNADITPDGSGGYSLTSDAQPFYDDCSTRDAVALSGQNIGDLLNKAGLSWGWFEGGFDPTESYTAALTAIGKSGQPDSTFIPDEFATAGFQSSVAHSSNQALCDAVHPVGAAFGGTGQWGYKDDYIPHHEPFQFYATTANPHHLTLATSGGTADAITGSNSLSTVGKDTQTFTGGYGVGPQFDTPNHNYDTSDFDQLVAAINAGQLPASALPAVTFLKAPGYEDGHAAYSDPADEQAFVVKEIDALMKTPDWSSTAVIINYDDSDGWYDHVYSGVENSSASPADDLTKTVTGTISATSPTSGLCGSGSPAPLGGEQGRCGFSSRLPMLVISPCARQNDVDHDLSDQASIINFIEYNWGLSSISGSYDQALAATDKKEGIPFDLAGMFDFTKCNAPAVQLDPASGEVDLVSANLKGKDLKGQNFAAALLSKANLDGANLTGGFLPAADLENATLKGASLAHANLRGADLTGADLTGANLSKAKLRGAKLTGAIWTNAVCPDGTKVGRGGSCAAHI